MDFTRMLKLVDKIQKMQPANPPPDLRFVEIEEHHKLINEVAATKHQKQQLLFKKRKVGSLLPEFDQTILSRQKMNYLQKKQRELELEQVRQEMAEQKRLEKIKAETQIQKVLQEVKERKEQTVLAKECKIKMMIDNDYQRKKKGQNSIDTSLSMSIIQNQSIIKKQIEDYHTLPRDAYNRIYKTNVSPPK